MKVRYNGTSILTCYLRPPHAPVQLAPGLNYVQDDAQATEFKNHPSVKDFIATKTIEILSADTPKLAKEIVVDIKDMFNVNELRKLEQSEAPSVSKAASKRLVELLGRPTPKGGADASSGAN
jgi:hypothetical protein